MNQNDVWDANDDLLIEKFDQLAQENLVEAIKVVYALEDDLERMASGRLRHYQLVEAGYALKQVSYENWGDGNEMEAVVEVLKYGKSVGFVRFNGTYSSWDASEWDIAETVQVVPRKIVQTVYLLADGSEDKNVTFA